jgi:predicted NBD/HSP70 family sugar kinase
MPHEQATDARWYAAARLLSIVCAEPGITRAAAAQRMGIGSGGAAELVARMRRLHLLDEAPAPVTGRGRPTTMLVAHPHGPLVVAVDIRARDWRIAVAGVDGAPVVIAEGGHAGEQLSSVLADIADAIRDGYRKYGARIVAVAVSVAGTVSGITLGQFTSRGWTDVDLSVLTAPIPQRAGVKVLLGNDATLAGLAEARTGAARGAGTALHLMVAVGIGGTLVVNGEPVTGAQGAAGEYGHIPFGDSALACPCGARGCWDLTVDGRALARHRGEPPPEDPVGYAHALLAQPGRDRRSRKAFDAVAAALGRGIGALVNVHDPDVVTLGGLAVPLRRAAPQAFDTAYRDGLMEFRKASPPAVLDGTHGEDGPLHGAVALALDHTTTTAGLTKWADRQSV